MSVSWTKMFGLMFEVEEEGDQTGAFAFIESSLSFHCLENLYYFKVLGSIPLIVNLDSLSVHDTVNVTLSNKFKVPITCVTENNGTLPPNKMQILSPTSLPLGTPP
jgi:hypothetical protein